MSRDEDDPELTPAGVIDRFMKYVEPELNSGCWLWSGGSARRGYGAFYFRGRLSVASRVSWIIFCGEIPESTGRNKICVLHRCDTPQCVNPSHLFLGTKKVNTDDMVSKRRMKRGESHPLAKLSWEIIPLIRIALANGETQQSIADRFGFTRSAIRKISEGKTWKIGFEPQP